MNLQFLANAILVMVILLNVLIFGGGAVMFWKTGTETKQLGWHLLSAFCVFVSCVIIWATWEWIHNLPPL